MKFTDNLIQSLKPTDKIQDLRQGKGFGIRVTPGGTKTWFFIYRIDGTRRFMNLGHYPSVTLAEANKRHRAAFDLYENGKDPLSLADTEKEARRKAPTVADLVDEYIKKHAKKFKKSWQEDERLLNKEVVPLWGKRKAADIKRRDATLLLESILDRGAPAMSNQVLKVTRKMFNFAVERDILQHTPFTGVKALAPNVSRSRFLTETEIKTLWGSIDSAAMSDEIKRAVKLVLVTAQRPAEVSGIHTSEIDGIWWTIPAERSKNKKAHRVPLSPLALEIITAATDQVKSDRKIQEDQEYSGFIFPCPHKVKCKPIDSHALPVAVRRNLEWPLVDAKGKPLYQKDGTPAAENRLSVEKFTPHDLRRTAATFMAGMGFMDEIVDAVLNHAKKGVIGTYNRHKYDKEKQQALESWGRKLNGILTGEKVVAIPLIRKQA